MTRVISKSSRATDSLQRLMIFSSLPAVTSIFLRQRKCYWGEKKALFFTLLPSNRVDFVFISENVHNSMAVFRKLQPGKLKKKSDWFSTLNISLHSKNVLPPSTAIVLLSPCMIVLIACEPSPFPCADAWPISFCKNFSFLSMHIDFPSPRINSWFWILF